MLERARADGDRDLTSRSARGLLPHYGEDSVGLPTVAFYHTFELRPPIGRHAEAIDDDVADLIVAIACAQAPIDFDRRAAPRPRARSVGDLTEDDRPIQIGAATGHPWTAATLGVLQQPLTISKHDEILEQSQEFLLLRGSENSPKSADNKAPKAGDVEIFAEQLVNFRQFLFR